jgi:hypothetical protein
MIGFIPHWRQENCDEAWSGTPRPRILRQDAQHRSEFPDAGAGGVVRMPLSTRKTLIFNGLSCKLPIILLPSTGAGAPPALTTRHWGRRAVDAAGHPGAAAGARAGPGAAAPRGSPGRAAPQARPGGAAIARVRRWGAGWARAPTAPGTRSRRNRRGHWPERPHP